MPPNPQPASQATRTSCLQRQTWNVFWKAAGVLSMQLPGAAHWKPQQAPGIFLHSLTHVPRSMPRTVRRREAIQNLKEGHLWPRPLPRQEYHPGQTNDLQRNVVEYLMTMKMAVAAEEEYQEATAAKEGTPTRSITARSLSSTRRYTSIAVMPC